MIWNTWRESKTTRCYDEFMDMSRLSHRNTTLQSGGITTSAKGENTFMVLDMPGRIAMDLLKSSLGIQPYHTN